MPDDWISAAEAFRVVSAAVGRREASRAICTRAHAGLIKARAVRFLVRGQPVSSPDIPAAFWWANGEAALEQNRMTGDFATWINRKRHLQAFGVTFLRQEIDGLVAPARGSSPRPVSDHRGGRPASAWWDDLWIDIARQLYLGDLKPRLQADIEAAMKDWAAAHGHNPADSTIRPRARKLWAALNDEDRN